MPGQPFSIAVSGQTDANGNALLNVFGFQAGIPAAFNLSLNVQGNSPFVSVLQGGIQLAAASAVNGNVQIGAIFTDGSSPITIGISEALPNTPISGWATGMQSDDPSDLSAITGQTSLTVGTVTAYDGTTLLGDNNVTYTGDTTFPGPSIHDVWDVRLWASVLMGIRYTGGVTPPPLLLTLQWYANPDASRLVGQRSMILDTIVETVVATIPNLGPYMQLQVERLSGGQFTWNASIVSSQRIVTDIFGGNFTPYLVEQYNQNLPPNNVTTYPVQTLYGGPVYASFRNNSGSPGNVEFLIDQMDSTGVYRTAGLIEDVTIAPGNSQQLKVVLPPVPCRVRVSSGTSAGTYSYDAVLWTTTTGST